MDGRGQILVELSRKILKFLQIYVYLLLLTFNHNSHTTLFSYISRRHPLALREVFTPLLKLFRMDLPFFLEFLLGQFVHV